jgi:hypothetical protein
VSFGLICPDHVGADIKKGTTDLAIFGNWSGIKFQKGAAGDADYEDFGTLAVGLGYFHTREIEFGVHGIGTWSKDLDLYSFGGNVKYHFTPDLTTVPYAGGQVNYAIYDSYMGDEQGMMYGPLAGVKYFVSRSVSIFFEYQYQIYDGNINDIIEDAHSIFVGIIFKIE